MAAFIIFAIRWAVTLTLLYSLYRLLLRRETFHRLNRAVLLGVLVASPLLPLMPLHTAQPTAMEVVLTQIEDAAQLSLSAETPTVSATPAAAGTEGTTSGLWVRYAAYIYIIGIGVALAAYLFRLLALVHVVRRSRRISHPMVPAGVRLMLDMRTTQPNSWMCWIFIGPIDLKQNAEPVLRHELAHVRMGHSWDMMLCDLTCRLLWCLPFAWMLRQDLVDVHEFQADEAVLRGGVTLEDYEHLLVRKAVQTQLLPIMNTLRRGAVKKRFAMMHSSRSSRWARLKVLCLVPALLASLWVSAQAEEYKIYLNGKLLASLKADKFYIDGKAVSREVMDAINPSTISIINVLHRQKMVLIETRKESADADEVTTEDLIDEKPQFPGGDAAMQQYLSQHVQYPKTAVASGVDGTVIVEFVVEADGSITDVTALEPSASVGRSNIVVSSYRQENAHTTIPSKAEGIRALQASSEELIRGMPPFEPGRQQGKAVRTKLTLPITYQLN